MASLGKACWLYTFGRCSFKDAGKDFGLLFVQPWLADVVFCLIGLIRWRFSWPKVIRWRQNYQILQEFSRLTSVSDAYNRADVSAMLPTLPDFGLLRYIVHANSSEERHCAAHLATSEVGGTQSAAQRASFSSALHRVTQN